MVFRRIDGVREPDSAHGDHHDGAGASFIRSGQRRQHGGIVQAGCRSSKNGRAGAPRLRAAGRQAVRRHRAHAVVGGASIWAVLSLEGPSPGMRADGPGERGMGANRPSGPQKPLPSAKSPADAAWQKQDDLLDEALEETFPASDPIAPGHVDPAKPTDPPRDSRR